jgi:hypothetical protein
VVGITGKISVSFLGNGRVVNGILHIEVKVVAGRPLERWTWRKAREVVKVRLPRK